jgi:hypothetical protein
MKNAIKILIIICVSICTNFSYSQDNTETYQSSLKLGVGLSGGLPLKDPYTFNVGGDVRLQYNISETYSLTFTTGYSNLFLEDDGVNFGYVPIKVGYKTFLFSNEFYVMAEMGGAFSVTKAYGGVNSIIFGPTLGYASKYIDFSLRYEILNDFPVIKDGVADDGLGQIMVRVAYGFDL